MGKWHTRGYEGTCNVSGSGVSDKILNALGKDTVHEMEAMTPEDLKKVVMDAHSGMDQAQKEMEENKNYREAKATLGHFTQGRNAVNKRQKARIKLAIELLDSMGKLKPEEYDDWRKRVDAYLAKIKEDAAARAKAVDEIAKATDTDGEADDIDLNEGDDAEETEQE